MTEAALGHPDDTDLTRLVVDARAVIHFAEQEEYLETGDACQVLERLAAIPLSTDLGDT